MPRGGQSKISIVVNGDRVEVPAGITVAAALFNHGVTALRTSVSGEPRGPVCAMGVCFECRVTIDSRPHQRACLTAAVDGMHIQTASIS